MTGRPVAAVRDTRTRRGADALGGRQRRAAVFLDDQPRMVRQRRGLLDRSAHRRSVAPGDVQALRGRVERGGDGVGLLVVGAQRQDRWARARSEGARALRRAWLFPEA